MNKLIAAISTDYIDISELEDVYWCRSYEMKPDAPRILGDTVLVNAYTRQELTAMTNKYSKFFMYRELECDCTLYVIGEASMLLKYLTVDAKATIRKMLRLFDLKSDVYKNKRYVKDVDLSHPNAVYLRDVLESCPKITVEKEPLIKPGELTKVTAKALNTMNKDALECGALRRLLGRFSHVYRQLELSCLETQTTEEFSYPVTQQQYNALALMQSYGTPFNSCQYMPVHLLSKDSVDYYLDNVLARELTTVAAKAASCFEISQYRDYGKGMCDRFFKLSNNNTVEKRFAIYYDNDGDYVFGNFYNYSSRSKLIIGGLTVESTAYFRDFEPDAYTYFNAGDMSVDESLSNYLATLEKL